MRHSRGLTIRLLIGSCTRLLLFPHAVSFSTFTINMCSDMCEFVSILATCVLYESLGSIATPNIFRSVFLGSDVLSICRCSCGTNQTISRDIPDHNILLPAK